MTAPVRMCSAPSCSMMAVPEAALLPRTPRPIRREKPAMTSGAKPSGKTGNGRSSTRPIISQWPVTESFPGDASRIRPNAPSGVARAPFSPIFATAASPSERSVGTSSSTCRARFPRVSLPSSPYRAASGSSPTPTPSRTITIARGIAGFTRRDRGAGGNQGSC